AEPAAPNGGSREGDALVARVLATLESWPNVASQFRQLLRVGDAPLTGMGEYWQQGIGNQRKTCWQWQTMVGGDRAVFIQVLDKNSCVWTDVRRPDKRTVTRVDLKRLRRDLALAPDAAGQGRGVENIDELEQLARGGLSQLVAELRRAFAFGPPSVVVEHGRSLTAVVGRWKPEALERVWPGLSDAAPGDWPSHLPHHVVIKAGQADFFPYAIEYRRGTDAALVNRAEGASDPLALYEFFNVRWQVTMPDRLFEFDQAELDWRDVTAEELERVRPAPRVLPAEVAERPGTWRL
ncbi:MAG TPA: hypothetical protein VEQ85_08735, partial [Lacipirellulaceae bacterium]|nr:hypothetical protein [Lacipirellulaceae bacterium]